MHARCRVGSGRRTWSVCCCSLLSPLGIALITLLLVALSPGDRHVSALHPATSALHPATSAREVSSGLARELEQLNEGPWTQSCIHWKQECAAINNLYTFWSLPKSPVSLDPCNDICTSNTSIVTCSPGKPDGAQCGANLTTFSPTNYTGLSVGLYNLRGPIPDYLGELGHLTYLDLHGNRFDGSIPSALCQLTKLQYLLLGSNLLSGSIPTCLAEMKSLKVIDLHSNRLSGTIPAAMGELKAMQTIYLMSNHLTGAIPSQIARATNLTGIWLDRNNLSGPLPAAIGSLRALISISVSDNIGINGSIPDTYTNLVALRTFNASSTSLSGSLPSCFTNMGNLTHVLLPTGTGFCPSTCCAAAAAAPIVPPPFRLPPDQSSALCQLCSDLCGACQPPDLSTGEIAALVVVCVLLLTVLAAAVGWWQWRKQFKKNKLAEWEEALNRAAFHRFSLRDIRLATNNFTRAGIIGQGAFGVVYRAQGPGDQVWAIKRSRLIAKDTSESNVFETEVRSVSRLSHRNLVRLLGYCSERGEQILVYEFVANGPLSKYLYANNDTPCLDFLQRLDVAIGTADGLSYLHSATQPAIVHRDVKPANILLDGNWQPRVADFGLVKDLGDGGASVATRVVGTRGYLDPEYFSRDKVTAKADVYSYGVVLMELVTGRPASSIDPTSETQSTIHISAWTIPYVLDGDITPIADPRILTAHISDHLMGMARIARDCMQEPGKLRPDMADVARMLRDIRRRAFGIGAEDLQLDNVPASPLAEHYSWSQSAPGSAMGGVGADSYVEFSGPMAK